MLAALRPVGCWCQSPFPILRDGAAPFNVLFICVVFFVAELEDDFALWRVSGLEAPYPVLRQARAGCTEVNGEDHHSPTPR